MQPVLPLSVIAEPDFRSLFEATPSPYLILAPDFTIVAVNDAYLRATRQIRADMIGRGVFQVFPDNPLNPEATDPANMRASLSRVLRDKLPDTMATQQYDIPIVGPDGIRFEERYWNAVNTPVLDAKGNLTHIIHRAEDVTGFVKASARNRRMEPEYDDQSPAIRKSANKRLREVNEELERRFAARTEELMREREYFQALLMAVPVPVSVLLGPEHVYRIENDAHRELMSHRDILGKPFREAFPDTPAWVLPTLDRIYRTGEPYHADRQKIFFNKYRTGMPENTYFVFSWHPLFGADGKVEGVITAGVDITAQVRTEERLRESKLRFRLMADSIPQIVWMADDSGRAVFFNQQWTSYTGDASGLMGPMAAEAVSESFVHPDDDAHTIAAWNKSLRTGQVFNIEHRIRSASGEYRWFLVRAEPYRNPGTGRIERWFGTSTDIHDSKMAAAALKLSEERYRALFNSIDEGFCIVDMIFDRNGNPCDYRFCEVNPMFEQQTGMRGAVGRTMRELVPDNEQHWFDIYGRVARTGEPVRFEQETRALGRWFDVYAFRADQQELNKVAILFKDVTGRRQEEERTRHAALHDPLTGLPNRAMLYEYASHLFPHNKRSRQSTAILFFDLDRFKPINDMHGHEVGDAVLKEVADRLSRNIRAEDIAIRLGGDEFVVLLQDIKASMHAADIARHIIAAINQPYPVGDLALSISASAGISVFPEDGQDIGTLIAHADMAMYQAKQAGRNNFQFYSPEFAAGTKLQAAIEQQLKSTLSEDAFHLFYQPVLDVATGEIISAEALLRWRNADIGPDQFVPIAEATGIINPIGCWLLEEASRQYKTWIAHGLLPIPISVNVSGVEFRDKDFVSRFEAVILKHGIGVQALQVEVTETAVMGELDHAIALLSQLKALGVTVLLDDFGTGHSSLAALARLPLAKVKIDRTFIARLESDLASRAVTDAMIALSRTLNLIVVAEGIETEHALNYIGSHGCAQAQGFYLGEPMPGDSFESWYWEHLERPKGAGPAGARPL
jgi:diguanylate cyclase (GGDEF)-like protein/PAS domain S-box-containing protein